MRGAPVFIVGCGRSGTTALGDVLGSHPRITYLNEPRRLWRTDPRTDVWTGRAGDRARLDLYDVDDETRARLRKRFFKQVGPDDRLVEKTPANSFRVDYIRALFPKAHFIHLLRNGLHVARSIQRWCEAGRRWYGADDVKWKLLVDYAERQGLGPEARTAGDDPLLRGLLEWRLSVSHLRARLTGDDVEVRYERLVVEPEMQVERLLGWMGLPPDGVDASTLARPLRPREPLEPRTASIAGDLLEELDYAAD